MTVCASTAQIAARRVPGENGTWVFLFGDMLVFGTFFATFMVERAKAPEIFDVSRKTLHIGVGLTNTVVLLTSSLFVVVALGGLRSGARHIARSAVLAAMVCGALFVFLKVFEYHSLAAHGHGVGANHFYLYYFILTGVHLFHVCVGMAVLAFLLTQARRHDIGETRMAVVEGGTCFWHLVDLLWIVLFPLLYLVA
ncbi:cytochrome c oxidase subunit III [Mycobacterium mantenii]|uniref:Probable cytochrome c oxidase subunit 3 n=1 Tax=Mycobacterium mantenii TaxID=560555 RepID=A0A1X0FZM8_MYCNT|nr:cytochrome c oxidase subunit 3 [Mycobacterium mantenii]MCV7241467.1 cytochrome c oxidase subunit 3 [Mycobacterium mantenii]ORB07015.1 cytochrome C oxidase subunit III [Mycobacterium mantenii]BBY40167.1 cytochrome c oxidase subunit III [Mycobacterium mantenii]